MPIKIPTCKELEESYKKNWNFNEYTFSLTGKYETQENANAYSSQAPYRGWQCVLVYEMVIKNNEDKSIFHNNSSLIWYDNINNQGFTGNVAYLYLVEILPDFHRKGIGTAYANVQHITLVNHGINVIYLKAGHYGTRFWTKMGYTFVDPEMFLMHYQEYCEDSDQSSIDSIDDIKEIPTEYFDYLRKYNIEYPMFRKLSD